MLSKKIDSINNSTALLILIVCLGYGLANVSDAVVKDLGGKFHTSQIIVFLSVLQFIILATYGFIKDRSRAFVTKKPKLMFLRAVLALSLAFLLITSLPNVELTTFYVVIFTSPFWQVIISTVFLKDKLTKARVGVTIFGLLVICAIFRPSGDNFDIWSLVLLLAAIVHASGLMVVRKLGKDESKVLMLLSGCSLAVLFFLPIMFLNYIEPTLYEWITFVVLSIITTTATLFVYHAFQHISSASIIAPYHYTQIVWGTLLGYFMFSDVPNIEVIIGSVLIVLSGLYLIYSERKNGKS